MDSYKNMHSAHKHFLPAVLLSMVFACAAAAQVPFQMQYTQGPIITTVANDSVLTLAAPLAQSQTLIIRAVYTGTGSVTVAQLPTVTGSGAFSATINQTLPITLQKDQGFVFTVRFAPSSPVVESARLILPFEETPATTVTPITLSLQGVTSAIVVSYLLPADNNVVPLSAGDTIPFPETLVGSSSPSTLNFTNIGSILGQVSKVTLSGAAFRLQGLPLFPANVAGGQNLQIQVLFRPTATGTSTGTVTIEIVGSAPLTINLTGTAVAPNLTYQFGTPGATVAPGGTITLPGIDVAQTSTTQIRVSNTGSGAATINTITVVGQGFVVASAPNLPQTLAPNTSLVFTVTFTPTRTGSQTGTLAVNQDVINLSGSGLGPVLTYSYVSGGSTITLGTGNNAVIFSPVRITESAQVGLDIKNTGAAPVTIQNIGVGQINAGFSVTNPPALPTVIAANATLRVNIKFEPTVLGFSNSTLIVDSNTITLTGSSTPPPALPAYTLSGPSGTVQPLAQPNVGLKLAAPYPVALTGTLTLAPASSTVPSDPTVQFATGGRTIAFRIPANTTDAIFGTQGTQVGLQTGTVAGTMTLTPSFATQAGSVDLTPATPVSSQFTVAAAVPALVSVQVLNPTITGFTLQVNGFVTTRTLTGLNIQLTTAPGYEMRTSQFALDLKTIAATWFQSTASQAFGGQFRITIPFNFQPTSLPAGSTILAVISSVSVTASNESGSSVALQSQTQ